MKKTIAFTVIVLPAFLLSACGTSKKLEQANKDLVQQKELSTQQSQKISSLEGDIKQLKDENIQYSKEAQDCRIARENIQKNLESLNNTISEGSLSLEKIFAKMDTTQDNFYDAGVEVTYKNGLVYISLHDHLMFKSGSSSIGQDGKDALAVVAEEFNKYPNISMYVIGNTDNKKVKSGSGYKDNWSLSTERANSIVRVLRDEYGVDPTRIISGGRSWYKPVGDNATEEGRAQNRRTEIIINPNLERLWEMSVKKD